MQCNHCGKDFRQARHWQRFCSTRCHDAWWRHQNKLEEVKDAEAVRDLRKHWRVDGNAIVEAIKYRRATPAPAVVAENGMKRRSL
jgi:hypothetical protein